MSATSISAPGAAPRRDALPGPLRSILADFNAWRERQALYRSTAAELGALTDRDLEDLGIARADIRRIAREAVSAASAR
ncbi:MAG TPA: DUF1127 domain-containing protein [Amaricoccus sp.]|uniref:DUF1127 domain-containing protein n=1 Tax=Amaricoccus sp. TaxID=1872485 RepID=UPI002CEB3E87|nr:DUF1127 domain-containing protein [Amaricoccus sp.]HMQ95525.1 DUF1127 domain-containing protein [Amaricoccus sp.]HMR54031.1 DUF1127 domain-containing protein [Amaricoccus sp.]HMR62325.1 DUF1127 domain-containing protein [Amaricoccus sp.]HMU01040.1 DUF1127 domain-containing protein [Amaricoccus sp.]